MNRQKTFKTIYAVRVSQSSPTIKEKSGHNANQNPYYGIKQQSSSNTNFILIIGDSELKQDQNYGFVFQQQKNRKGSFQLALQATQKVPIIKSEILLQFPLECHIQNNKYIIPEEEFGRLISQYNNVLMQTGDSDESSLHSISQPSLQQRSSFPIDMENRKRGRPKGSKNRQKQNDQSSSDQSYQDTQFKKKEQKRGRGRPPGSRNKKKIVDQMLNQHSIQQLFITLVLSKSREQLNRKFVKAKFPQGLFRKKDHQEQSATKRGRGRPKGVKNKPKIIEQSYSEEHISFQQLPPRKQESFLKGLPKCCARCEQRDIKRKILQGKANIPSNMVNIAENIGIQDTHNLIISAIKSSQQQILKKIMKYKNQIQYTFIVGWDTNWRFQKTFYTVRTKKEYLSKNQRQGVNVLLHDCLPPEKCWWKTITIQKILESMPNSESSIELYDIITEDDPQLVVQIYKNLPCLVRAGNQVLSAHLLKKLLENDELNATYGYSKQHLECLNNKRQQLQFRKSTMLKQNCTNNFLSPIHCAVINSNTQLLYYIMKHISQFNVGDSLSRKPIHYAVVLQNTKNLQILLKYGADLKEMDKKKTTPLMLACMYGRYNCIKFILDKVRDSQYLNFKNEDGLSALHFAVIGRHYQCVTLLLKDTLIDYKLETKQGMSLLHLASGVGHLQIYKQVVKIVQFNWDFYRRSPLMFAIRNHNNQIFFDMIFRFPKYYRKDYSCNSLLHYAAAYGNIQICQYLLEVCPLIMQVQNKKNIFPWQIAVLKGHYQCAKMLENLSLSYNPHFLHRLLKNPRGHPDYIKMIKYVLGTKLYDVNYQNSATKATCLHFLCSISEKDYINFRSKQVTNIQPNQYQYMQKQLISLLLEHGADPSICNDKDQKPVILCIQNENLIGIQLLLQQIPFATPRIKNNHFVYYLCNLGCRGKQEMKFILKKLKEVDESVLRVELKKTDNHGFEFLVYLIKRFTQTAHKNFYDYYQTFLNEKVGSESMDINGWKNHGSNVQELKKARAIFLAISQFIQFENQLINMINFLIEMGSDPNAIVYEPRVEKQYQNYRNWSIQHFLMKFPSLRLLKIFMKWNRNSTLRNSQGRTPLHLFTMWNTEGSLFSNYHADIVVPQIKIQTLKAALPYLKLSQKQLEAFELFDNYDGNNCLQFLLQNGLSPNILDINKSLPLLYAALNGQASFIILLRRFGSAINNQNSLNQVPLIQIVKMKNQYTLSQIQEFIRLGADPNFQDNNKRNALHHLVSNSTNFDTSPQICKLLFDRGVQVNSLDNFGRSPIFYCFIKIQTQDMNISTDQPNNDKVEIIQTLLNHSEIDLNIRDIYQRTPLHYACQKNFFFSILYLLDKNINYDMPDAQGNTPLAICLKHRNLNQAALLIKKSVKYGYVFDGKHKYSYFAYAINKLSVGICFMLIDHGYPLQKALEEVPNDAFKKVLNKRYM